MPQAIASIPNTNFPTFRANLNAALEAIVTKNSGVLAPTTTYPFMWWADTTNGFLKMRNAGNTAWNTIGVLGSDWFGVLPATIGALSINTAFNDLTDKAVARANLGVAPNKNYITNGNFAINQRGTNPYTIAADGVVYAYDRWRVYADDDGGSPSNVNLTRANGIATFSNSTSEFATIITIANQGSSLGAGSLWAFENVIADVYKFSGKTITISFNASSNITSKTLGVAIYQYFGVGGSASVFVTGQSVTLTNTGFRYFLTFNVPSVAGKTIGANGDNCTVFSFFLQAGTATATARSLPASFGFQGLGIVRISDVKIETGSYATEYIQPLLSEDMAECLAYFEIVNTRMTGKTPTTTLGNVMDGNILYYPKRNVPTLLITGSDYGGGSFNQWLEITKNRAGIRANGAVSNESVVFLTIQVSCEF